MGKQRKACRVDRLLAAWLTCGITAITLPATAADSAKAPDARTFELTYSATVTGLEPGQTARVWIPLAQTNNVQDVEVLQVQAPAAHQVNEEGEYCNKMLYVEAPADAQGRVPVSVKFRVTRREVTAPVQPTGCDDLERYLAADAMVPLGGPASTLIAGQQLPESQLELARLFYNVVFDHMSYSKEGTGWGRGDVAWACDSRYGNCSDFHSVFIALARANSIPARFEIGFPLPPDQQEGEITGYHCWAWFFTNEGWVPVDISEADKLPEMKEYYFGNLTKDRVAFTTGRDIDLVPQQSGKPLNFFVYPYVEVGGQEYPLDKIERKFTFRNVSE